MHRVDLTEAGPRLAELADEAARGADVIITRGDGASFKLVLVAASDPRPRFGSASGRIEIADDFDEPLEDFRDYAP